MSDLLTLPLWLGVSISTGFLICILGLIGIVPGVLIGVTIAWLYERHKIMEES